MESTAYPLVTVVTPSFNQAAFIEQTLQSVLNQDYPNLEYIVIDGGSTDGSVQILERYSDKVKWISEPDHGQADAINKGFRQAKGEILGWVNADDKYAPHAISQIVGTFNAQPEYAFIYGDAVAIDRRSRPYGKRAHVHQTDFRELLECRDFIVQPAAFWRAGLWHTIGELDTNLRYALDYEYWMRAARCYTLHYVPLVLAEERIYAQTKTFSGAIARIAEIEAIAQRHGGAGLPRSYHGEAAVAYIMDAMNALLHGRAGEARERLRSAFRFRPHFARFVLLLGSELLLGPKFAARRTLWLNRLRAMRQAP